MEMGSDSTPVEVNLDGVDVYLADSMQFLLEYGCRLRPKGCFSFMPSYRGEHANESHLSQFYNSEVEVPGDFNYAVRLAEKYLRCLCKAVFNGCEELALKVIGDISHVARFGASRQCLPRITMDEAERILGGRGIKRMGKHRSRTINRAGELRLIQEFCGAVWLTHPDHRSVPFYQAYGDELYRTAKAADLLMGIGEMIGLGERHATEEAVRKALHLHELNSKVRDYDWYISIRQLQPMVTSGFGLGVERFFCWALQHNDIRDCQLFLRFRGKRPVV